MAAPIIVLGAAALRAGLSLLKSKGPRAVFKKYGDDGLKQIEKARKSELAKIDAKAGRGDPSTMTSALRQKSAETIKTRARDKRIDSERLEDALDVINEIKDEVPLKFSKGGLLSTDSSRIGYADGELVGGQKELDKNNDGDITGEDFAILREEREKVFGGGGILVKPITKMISFLLRKNKNKATDSIKVSDAQLDKLQKQIDEGADLTGTSAEEVANLTSQMSQDANALRARGFNNKRIEELLEEAYTLGESKDLELALEQPIRTKKQEGGMMMDDQMDSMMQREETPDMENQMADMMSEKNAEEMAIEESQVPDEMMEDNYLDFLIDEALDEDEEEMLMQELEANPQLSMLFDKVMEVAMEFSGSGPVEGPGTEVSDSIPARLSDGEFVFTAKAVEVLGADNLMSLMKQAEAQAEGRQMAQDGGLMEEEDTAMPVQQEPVRQEIRVTKETVGSEAAMQEEEDLVGDELKKQMLSGRPHVRS